MTELSELSRRERQIMSIVFARQGVTVQELCDALPDPPTPMAVRRMLAILQEKGHLKRKKSGREFVYQPRASKQRAGLNAFRDVLETFFDGSIGDAVATHLAKPGAKISDQDIERLASLIDELDAKNDARESS